MVPLAHPLQVVGSNDDDDENAPPVLLLEDASKENRVKKPVAAATVAPPEQTVMGKHDVLLSVNGPPPHAVYRQLLGASCQGHGAVPDTTEAATRLVRTLQGFGSRFYWQKNNDNHSDSPVLLTFDQAVHHVVQDMRRSHPALGRTAPRRAASASAPNNTNTNKSRPTKKRGAATNPRTMAVRWISSLQRRIRTCKTKDQLYEAVEGVFGGTAGRSSNMTPSCGQMRRHLHHRVMGAILQDDNSSSSGMPPHLSEFLQALLDVYKNPPSPPSVPSAASAGNTATDHLKRKEHDSLSVQEPPRKRPRGTTQKDDESSRASTSLVRSEPVLAPKSTPSASSKSQGRPMPQKSPRRSLPTPSCAVS